MLTETVKHLKTIMHDLDNRYQVLCPSSFGNKAVMTVQ